MALSATLRKYPGPEPAARGRKLAGVRGNRVNAVALSIGDRLIAFRL